MDDAVVVALFRHGITEGNKRKQYIGWTDASICMEAEEALISAANHLSLYNQVFSSDLKRCLQTAHALFPNETPCPIMEFREFHFGDWEGKSYYDLKDDPYYKEWLNHYFSLSSPNGESYPIFTERVERGWQTVLNRIAEQNLHRIAIVTHGGVIRYLLSRFCCFKKEFWEWEVPHGNGFELVWSSQIAFRRGERCTLLREVPLTANRTG